MCKGPGSRELDVTRLEFCETVVGGGKNELVRDVELLSSLRLMKSFIKRQSCCDLLCELLQLQRYLVIYTIKS